MQNILILVAVVAVAYLLAHKAVEWFQDRFLIAAGAEYILVGLLLGPEMPWPPAFQQELLSKLSPVLNLAIGWVGLLYGMSASLREIVQAQDGSEKLALSDAVISLLAIGGATWAMLSSGLLGSYEAESIEVAAAVLGSAAAVGSTSVLDLVRRRFDADGPLTELLDRAVRLGDMMAIVVFGVALCIYHHTAPGGVAEGWNYANWILVTFGLGLGLGLLFRLFLGDEHDADKQFLALLGIIVFASGAAWELELSPLLVNLILGVSLANVAPNADEILETLKRYHRSMIILLFIFAGALWKISGVPGPDLLLALLYVGARLMTKFGGGWVTAASLGDPFRRDIGRGMLGHGEAAVAMALSYKLVYEGPLSDMVFTAILLSVILGEIWSVRAVRGLLIDGGDVPVQALPRAERAG